MDGIRRLSLISPAAVQDQAAAAKSRSATAGRAHRGVAGICRRGSGEGLVDAQTVPPALVATHPSSDGQLPCLSAG
jgi:hypothetical protein